jgi:hypothetical protein
MFRAVPLPIIRSQLTVHLALVCVIPFEDSFQAGPGWYLSYGLKTASKLGRDSPAWKLSSNRMTHTIAKCTVNGLLTMGRGTA